MPIHELAVAEAFVIRTLAKGSVSDVPRVEVGQLLDLASDPCAAFALFSGRAYPSAT